MGNSRSAHLERKRKAKQDKIGYDCVILAYDYLIGDGTKKDYHKALKWFLKGAELKHGSAEFALGEFYEKNEDYYNIDKAIYWYKRAYEHGYYLGYYNLALLYYYGEKVRCDLNKAFLLFKEFEKRSGANEPAISMLGWCYLNGFGTEINYEKAVEYFKRSLNIDRSKVGLGRCYYNGLSLTKDYEKACKLFEQAALNNYEKGCRFYAYCLFYGNGTKEDIVKAFEYIKKVGEVELNYDGLSYYILAYCYDFGIGTKANGGLAFKYYLKGHDLGNKNCSFGLGQCYFYGKVTNKNYKLALKYFEESLDAGYNTAYFYLGEFYFSGLGVEKDYKKAFDYYLKCYEKTKDYENLNDRLTASYFDGYGVEKNIQKAYELALTYESGYSYYVRGMCLYYGNAITKNVDQALKCFEKSCELNNVKSLDLVGHLYLDGNLVKKDVQKGISYITKAADFGFTKSISTLAEYYFFGFYVEKDDDKAYKYAKKAYDRGDKTAKCVLGNLYATGHCGDENIDLGYKLIRECALDGTNYGFNSYAVCCILNRYGSPEELFKLFEKNKSVYKEVKYNEKTVYKDGFNVNVNFIFYNGGAKYCGFIVDDCANGIGIELYSNGYYCGEFKNGKRNGKGKYYWKNGSHYEGDFVNGTRTGKGTIWWNNGTIYKGDFLDGYATGHGEMWFSNGSYYKGEVFEGKMNGYGILVYSNGDKEIGSFKDDEPLNTKYTKHYESNDDSSYDSDYYGEESKDFDDSDYFDYDYDSDYDDFNNGYTTLVDDYENETEINNITGRDSEGNLWESDGYFSDTYHMVDEDDDD